MAITKEQEKEYIKSGGCSCPVCDSSNIDAGRADFEGNLVYSRVNCNDCGEEWDDVFQLTGVSQ